MKWPTTIALVFSGVWLLVAGAIWYYNPSGILMMSPNEWGDFLAGVAAPPALVWLVAGYFQHTEEVHLQTEELHHHVEEAKRLAEHSEQLLEREKERDAPDFISTGATIGEDTITVTVLNRGGEVRDIDIDTHDYPGFIEFDAPRRFEQGQTGKLMLRKTKVAPAWPYEFSIVCRDKQGRYLAISFQLHDGFFLEQDTMRHVKPPGE